MLGGEDEKEGDEMWICKAGGGHLLGLEDYCVDGLVL
jgi:hypothetical protein